MKIVSNQPFCFSYSKEKSLLEVGFLGEMDKNIDAIVLMCSNIMGDLGIPEMQKLIRLIKQYPIDVAPLSA